MSQKLSASTMVQELRLKFSGFENPKSNGAMRQLLWLVVIHGLLTPVQSLNGVMWNKKISDFVPIVSEPIFAAMNQEVLDRSRAKETYNFEGRTLRFSYYEMNYVIASDKNGTSIKGYIGDTWKILAEYLHFTLKPESSSIRTLGVEVNGTYTPGLLKMIHLNQTDIIARVEATSSRSAVVQLTVPFRSARCTIFTRQERKHVTTWMLKLFSREVWFSTLAIYIILSICSYIFHVIEVDVFGGNMIPDILDSLFYNLGMICIQNCNTNAMSKSSRMIECLVSLFALLINTVFNALVIGYVTQVVAIKPFSDIISFLQTSEYSTIFVKGSLPHLRYQETMIADRIIKSRTNKVIVVNSLSECYKTLCTKELTAAYLTDEMSIQMKHPCRLESLGATIRLPLASGISWNIENKRSIDIGLLKLYESGLLNAIQRNWFRWWKKDSISQVPTAIEMEQVYLVYLLFFGGQGIVKTNISGRPCLQWLAHFNLPISDYPELAGQHSYCRNPDETESQPWCYVDVNHTMQKEFCDIPKCVKNLWIYAIVGFVLTGGLVILVCYCCCYRSRKSTRQMNHLPSNKMLTAGPGNTTPGTGTLSSGSSRTSNNRVPQFSTNNVVLLQELGEGAFGKIYKGELQTGNKCEPPIYVAVKTLKENASPKTQNDFKREVDLMTDLRHPNIICLLGVILKGEPMCTYSNT